MFHIISTKLNSENISTGAIRKLIFLHVHLLARAHKDTFMTQPRVNTGKMYEYMLNPITCNSQDSLIERANGR